MIKTNVQIEGIEFKQYIDVQAIAKIVANIGHQIMAHYTNREIVVIGVLKGAFVFMNDLLRAMDRDVEVGFVKVSSYDGLESSGSIHMSLDFDDRIIGKDVLIIEDIIDTGLTAQFLLDRAHLKGAKSVAIAALLVKPDRLQVELPIDFIGKEIPDDFVIGYGMDYNEKGRCLDCIYQKV